MLSYICASVLLLVIAYRAGFAYLESQYCAAGDIARAGGQRDQPKLKGRAVVIGASVTGLLAARVCATHFEEVVLLDAEDCSTDPQVKRTRVKQHSQLHLFLSLLSPALKSLFPSWSTELQQAGGTVCSPSPTCYRAGGFTKLPGSGWPLEQLYISRESFEALLRRLVLAFSPVNASTGTVTRLVPSPDRKRISSVIVRRPDGKMEEIAASLVIDASGTTNGSINWLRREGYSEPQKLSYDPRIRYTCMTWQLMPQTIVKYDALATKQGSLRWHETGHLGSAFIADHASSFMRIDGDRVRCLYQTILDDGREIVDTASMQEAVHDEPYSRKSLALLDVVWNAERDDGAPTAECKHVNVGVCYQVKFQPNDMPTNMIPMGDTLCRVNPIFGQGCTKSMIDALTLDHVLRATGSLDSPHLVKHFLDLHEKRTRGIWKSVQAHDYGLVSTIPLPGDTLEVGHLQRELGAWFLRASHKDPFVGGELTCVTGQVKSFWRLYSPFFLLRCAMVNHGLL